MAIVSLSNISQIIERLYKAGIKDIGLGPKTKFWSMMPKHPDFYESTYDLRNQYGLNPSGSHAFADSRVTSGNSPFGTFRITRVKDYLTLQLDGETLRATNHKASRQVRYIDKETRSLFMKAGRRINRNLFRNSGGALGQVVSGGATQTITVLNREALIGVFPNMQLVSSNTDGTSGAVDANPTTVESVDRENGTITTAAASWDAVAGFTDNDFFFARGDFGLAMTGADGWVPSSIPTDTLFSQDRSLDGVYLGGVRYVASGGDPDGTILRTFTNASAEGSVHGAECDYIFMHPLDYAIFLNEIGTGVVYVNVKGRLGAYDDEENMVDVGITGVRVMLPTGPATVCPDHDCQRNTAWMIDMKTWGFYGLGMTGPEFLDHDDNGKFMRMTYDDSDAIEGTVGWYGQIGCEAPGCNIRVDLTNVL